MARLLSGCIFLSLYYDTQYIRLSRAVPMGYAIFAMVAVAYATLLLHCYNTDMQIEKPGKMNIAVEDGLLSLLGLKSVSSLTSGEVGDFLLKLLFEVKRTNFMSNYINTKFTYLSIFQYSGVGEWI